MFIDYSSVGEIFLYCMICAFPINFVFNIMGKIYNFFFGIVTGKEKVVF